MNWLFPTPDEVQRACDLYIEHAYATSSIPSQVSKDLEAIRSASAFGLADLSVWERDRSNPPARLALRLGNQFYPHMKLAIDRQSEGAGYVFRVDTHDQHLFVLRAQSEMEKFAKLMKANRQIAKQIETAWQQHHLPTSCSFSDLDGVEKKAEMDEHPSPHQFDRLDQQATNLL